MIIYGHSSLWKAWEKHNIDLLKNVSRVCTIEIWMLIPQAFYYATDISPHLLLIEGFFSQVSIHFSPQNAELLTNTLKRSSFFPARYTMRQCMATSLCISTFCLSFAVAPPLEEINPSVLGWMWLKVYRCYSLNSSYINEIQMGELGKFIYIYSHGFPTNGDILCL